MTIQELRGRIVYPIMENRLRDLLNLQKELISKKLLEPCGSMELQSRLDTLNESIYSTIAELRSIRKCDII